MSVTYNKVSGVLPIGVTIEKDGKVKGILDFENLDMNPVWITPNGVLAELEEFDEVELPPLEVEVREGRTFDSFTVIPFDTTKYGYMPFGLKLNSLTGVIHGTLYEQTGSLLEKTWYDGEEPQWVDDETHLGDFFVGEDIEISIQAVSPKEYQVFYTITEGILPAGIHLNSLDGTISGTCDNLQIGYDTDLNNLFKKPFWVTPRGMLGSYGEYDTVEQLIQARSNNGLENVYYTIVSGTLPSGIHLNSLTGEITGVCDELKEGGLSVYEYGNAPVISGNILIDDEVVEIDDGQPLIAVQNGDIVQFKFIVTPYEGRTIKYYSIVCDNEALMGTLPSGLFLNASTGVVSGAITSTTALGEYEFYLYVVDSKNVYSMKKFKIVVD